MKIFKCIGGKGEVFSGALSVFCPSLHPPVSLFINITRYSMLSLVRDFSEHDVIFPC